MTAGQGATSGPEFLAHRGYQARYPENTRESLQAAVDAGARLVEFDVQLSGDGVPVLLHDPSLMRTAGLDRQVFDMDAAELAAIEVNEQQRLGPGSTGAALPLLADIASAMAGWPGVTVFVELKPQSMTRFGVAHMLEATVDVLRPVLDRCVLISFVHDVMHEARLHEQVRVGWVLSTWDEVSRATAEAAPPDGLPARAGPARARRPRDLHFRHRQDAGGTRQGSGGLVSAHYDLAVVGAGINGAGIAQAAAAAGHTVLLLEKTGIATGTSQGSSKLIHGGLRYLETWEFGLVRESLHERALLCRIAPDLVQLKDFYVPIFAQTRRRPWLLHAGLSLYYALSGFDRDARYATVTRREWDTLDGLKTDGLSAVFRYHDAQTDDRLLTQAVVNSARDLGAAFVCPARLVSATVGADATEVVYDSGGSERSATATVLVNAAGHWANEVLARVQPAVPIMPVELVQGTHIVVQGTLRKGFYYVESPRDGRAVFVMPWYDQILVGTTETRFHGEPDSVRPLATEIRYLCRVLGHYFPAYAALGQAEVLGTYVGVRVLPAGEGHVFARSRDVIMRADRPPAEGPPRVFTLYGGKLTTYRRIAEQAMQRIAAALPARRPVANTASLRLHRP
jgi:glycerol-3-phosphate dehydrogenase